MGGDEALLISVRSILDELHAVHVSLRARERKEGGRKASREEMELGELHTRRAAAAAQLPVELANHYHRLCRGRSLPVAIVAGGHCSGCQLRLPAQTVNAGRSGGGYLVCPHCQRILLVPDAETDAASWSQGPARPERT